MLVKLPKPVRLRPKKLPTIKSLRNKADRLLQELGRKTYDECCVCGGTYSCLHHFYTKGSSNVLRYNLKNCFPICVSCHCKHHNGQDPSVHAYIIKKMGWPWFQKLEKLKYSDRNFKANREWYEENIKVINKCLTS